MVKIYGILKEVFIKHCIENKGCTKKEAEALFLIKGEVFLNNAIENLYDAWDNDFKKDEKDEECQ